MTFKLNQWQFVRGEAVQFICVLLDANQVPINISGATAISFALKKEDGTLLEKPADNGYSWGILPQVYVYGFSLTEVESALLKLGKAQTLVARVTISGHVKNICFEKSVEVTDPVM